MEQPPDSCARFPAEQKEQFCFGPRGFNGCAALVQVRWSGGSVNRDE